MAVIRHRASCVRVADTGYFVAMTTKEVAGPARPTVTLIAATLLGAAVALVFALVIRVVPEAVFEPRSLALTGAFVVGIIAGPPSVWFVQTVVRPPHEHRFDVLLAAMLGAMTFDGIAIGFVPGLYGQDEMGAVGAFLLIAFVALGLSGRVMCPPDRAAH